jgi:hypothetical protein
MKKTIAALLLIIPIASSADWYGTASIGEGYYLLSNPSNPAWCQRPFECREGKGVAVWSLGSGWAFTKNAAAELTYHDFGKYTQSGAWRCSDDGSMCTPWTTFGESEARTRGVSLSAVFGADPGLYGRVGLLRYQSKWMTQMRNSEEINAAPSIYVAQRQEGWSPEVGVGWRFHTGLWVNDIWQLELTRYTDIKPHDGAIQGITTVTLQMAF